MTIRLRSRNSCARPWRKGFTRCRTAASTCQQSTASRKWSRRWLRWPGFCRSLAMFWKRLRLTLEMIKFEHSVFALPFALTGALLAFREGSYTAASIGRTLLWIAVAMVGARSAAMAFNRLVDADIDARNPRTKMRHLPAGLLSRGFGWAFVAAASLIFFAAAWALNPLCLKLAPAALGIIFCYSYTKRFTALSHLVLGFCL